MNTRAASSRLPQRTRSVPRTPKQRGELAEVRFLAKAMSLGFVVSKPYGDSARYDFVLDAGHGRFLRIQVKSAWTLYHGKYVLNCTTAEAARARWGRWRSYRPSELDFVAAYLAPEDSWYIIPVHLLRKKKTIYLFPADRKVGLYLRYREAWGLFASCHYC